MNAYLSSVLEKFQPSFLQILLLHHSLHSSYLEIITNIFESSQYSLQVSCLYLLLILQSLPHKGLPWLSSLQQVSGLPGTVLTGLLIYWNNSENSGGHLAYYGWFMIKDTTHEQPNLEEMHRGKCGTQDEGVGSRKRKQKLTNGT